MVTSPGIYLWGRFVWAIFLLCLDYNHTVKEMLSVRPCFNSATFVPVLEKL